MQRPRDQRVIAICFCMAIRYRERGDLASSNLLVMNYQATLADHLTAIGGDNLEYPLIFLYHWKRPAMGGSVSRDKCLTAMHCAVT